VKKKMLSRILGEKEKNFNGWLLIFCPLLLPLYLPLSLPPPPSHISLLIAALKSLIKQTPKFVIY